MNKPAFLIFAITIILLITLTGCFGPPSEPQAQQSETIPAYALSIFVYYGTTHQWYDYYAWDGDQNEGDDQCNSPL